LAINNLDSILPGLNPILEEQPKWQILSSILDEIERDIHFKQSPSDDSYETILIMCSNDSDDKVCKQLREYLQSLHNCRDSDHMDIHNTSNYSVNMRARYFMNRNLARYLAWKRDMPQFKAAVAAESSKFRSFTDNLPKNQEWLYGRASHNKRRRMRGGGRMVSNTTPVVGQMTSAIQIPEEPAAHISSFIGGVKMPQEENDLNKDTCGDYLEYVDSYYQSYQLKDLVVVHPFNGDVDDQLLEELRPKYIIMYNPDAAFVRRVEV
jgi:DNA excision repair protein ERCC-4